VDDSSGRRYVGTGLGLHLSQRLAEALGGRIEFRSEYGRGSSFTLVLREG
jgi:protein-histidine pros-kinase